MSNDVSVRTLDLSAVKAEVIRRIQEGPGACTARDGHGASHLRLLLLNVLGSTITVHADGRCVYTAPRKLGDGTVLFRVDPRLHRVRHESVCRALRRDEPRREHFVGFVPCIGIVSVR